MKSSRNAPPSARNTFGTARDLRDMTIIPETYRSYKVVDGKEVFIGEFPTPQIGDKAQTQIDIKRS